MKTLWHPADRRRFLYYAKKRNINFENEKIVWKCFHHGKTQTLFPILLEIDKISVIKYGAHKRKDKNSIHPIPFITRFNEDEFATEINKSPLIFSDKTYMDVENVNFITDNPDYATKF